MAYAAGDHRSALFATALVLLLAIVILNTIAGFIQGRYHRSHKPHSRSRAALVPASTNVENAEVVSR
jgi:hypothetical protein